MKILFFMRYYSYIAHYEEALRQLSARGHHIHFAFDNRHRKPFDKTRMEQFFDIPNTSFDFFPDTAKLGWWAPFADVSRRLIDYLRYFHADFSPAAKLRQRAARRVPAALRFAVDRAFFPAATSAFWIRILKIIEKIFPLHSGVRQYLKKHAPDLVLFTPLVDSNAGFIDFAKAAKAMGIPSVICVASWDNLTNKGLIQADCSAVLVWNEFQKQEAVKYHGIVPGKIVVTGAQTFDKWFEKKPALSKKEFMRKVGLADYENFVVYACSSRFIAKTEPRFIEMWVREISRHPYFRNVGIMIRPHPANPQEWKELSPDVLERAVVYPQWEGIPYPFPESDKIDYLQTLLYASAVIGINTSAMIEAGIQGTPVFTVLAEDFKETQQGTLHFSHIQDHGLLTVAKNLGEHILQLEEVMSGKRNVALGIRNFIEKFVRPHGLKVPCSPRVAKVLESLGEQRSFSHHDCVEASDEAANEFKQLSAVRKKYLIQVNQPLILISQIHRSGGTLLSQLLDSHPQIHCHPYELQIGYPDKTQWPELDLKGTSEEWYRRLFEPSIPKLFKEGYTKRSKGWAAVKNHEPHPFLMVPLLQKTIFLEAFRNRKAGSVREILNVYMTAYFNSWLDNHNLYQKEKKWITAFVPRLSSQDQNIDRFFDIYPDGKLIQILREPKSWYASAFRHLKRPESTNILEQAGLWRDSVQAMIRVKQKYSDGVRIIRFEDLVRETEMVMRYLCAFLDISFHSILLEPTFNFLPIKADSSFTVNRGGILPEASDRSYALTVDEQNLIDSHTGETYAAALKIVDVHAKREALPQAILGSHHG